MIDASVGFALAAGMVAAFNPCGFAMLPAYISLFLGTQGSAGQARSGPAVVARALGVAGAVSAGFIVVFGLAGLVLARASLAIVGYLPWLTLVVGVALIPLGVAMVRGYEPVITLPRLQRGGSGRGVASMFLYGVSYATVSLSCTLPVFLAAVAGTFTRSSFVSGIGVFAAYAAGMGLVLVTVTLVIALAHQSATRRLRRVLPYVGRVSGLLLVIAGAYVAYYGYWELRINAGEPAALGPVGVVAGMSARVESWINSAGAGRLGAALLLLIASVLVWVWLRSRRPASGPVNEPTLVGAKSEAEEPGPGQELDSA